MADAFQIPPFQPIAFQEESILGAEEQQEAPVIAVASLLLARAPVNKLPPYLRRKISFYAPLVDHLDYFGVSGATFVRNSTSTTTWRNGLTVNIAINVPRYHYVNSSTPWGINLNPASETLTFPQANLLHDGGHLFWVENGVVKHAPGDSNPINSSGVVTGSERKLRDFLKFPNGVTLTTAEVALVTAALTL